MKKILYVNNEYLFLCAKFECEILCSLVGVKKKKLDMRYRSKQYKKIRIFSIFEKNVKKILNVDNDYLQYCAKFECEILYSLV